MAVAYSGGSHVQCGDICFASCHVWLVVARWACKGLRENSDNLAVPVMCHDHIAVHAFIWREAMKAVSALPFDYLT